MTVKITLTDEMSRIIETHVASGQYASASEVVNGALKLLERHQENIRKLEWLREAWRTGIESGDAGPLDAEAIKAEARAKRSALLDK